MKINLKNQMVILLKTSITKGEEEGEIERILEVT